MLITDLGDNSTHGGSPLVCKTIDTNCRRKADGSLVGQWYYPDGSIVLSDSTVGCSVSNIFTTGVSLNRRSNAVGPLGVYTCVVPDEKSGANITASITIVDQIQGG